MEYNSLKLLQVFAYRIGIATLPPRVNAMFVETVIVHIIRLDKFIKQRFFRIKCAINDDVIFARVRDSFHSNNLLFIIPHFYHVIVLVEIQRTISFCLYHPPDIRPDESIKLRVPVLIDNIKPTEFANFTESFLMIAIASDQAVGLIADTSM